MSYGMTKRLFDSVPADHFYRVDIMPMFNSPTSFFVGNLNEKDKKFEKSFFKKARDSGFTKFIEPCSGELAMSQIAIESGFDEIEASDITLFSTLMGYYVTGKPIDELEVEVESVGRCNDVIEILYWQLLFKLRKNEGQFYFDNYIRDVEEKKDFHKQKIKDSLDIAKKRFEGKVQYFPMDMTEHLKKFVDDEHALVVMNFPTYKGGYEKIFDVGDKITWKEPAYEMFDPKTDKPKIKEMLKDAKCLVLFYEEALPGETVFEPVYARFGARDGMNTYITTNDIERAQEIIGKRFAVWQKDRKLTPLNYPLIENDYEFTENSKVEVISADVENCAYYRKLMTHNFAGTNRESGFAVIVDGRLLGVFGYSKTFTAFFGDGEEDSLYIQFAMAKYVKGYRVNRLLTMIEICNNHFDAEGYDKKLSYVAVRKILGGETCSKKAGETIKKAVSQMVKNGEADSKWQAMEKLAEDYLNGEEK